MLDLTSAFILVLIAGIVAFVYALLNIFQLKSFVTKSRSHNYSLFMNERETGERVESVEANVQHIIEGVKLFFSRNFWLLAVSTLILAILVFFLAEDIFGHFWMTLCFVVSAAICFALFFIGNALWSFGAQATLHQTSVSLGSGFSKIVSTGTFFAFLVQGILLLLCVGMLCIYKAIYGHDKPELYRNFIGLALGASLFSLFLRISGGIFAKSGDLGADLLGKAYERFEYRKRLNPIIMTDLSGDIVGDLLAGTIEFFAVALTAIVGTISVQSNYKGFAVNEVSYYYSLVVLALAVFVGIVVNVIFTIVANKLSNSPGSKIFGMQRIFYIILALVMIPFLYIAAYSTIPDNVEVGKGKVKGINDAFYCSLIGLAAGLINCLSTEHFTSMSFKPVKEVAASSETGAATVVIYGLALGYKATVIPSVVLAIASFSVFTIFGFFGFGAAAMGMLAFQSQVLVNMVSGPISDVNCGLCEVSLLPESTFSNCKKLNTIGKIWNVTGMTYNLLLATFAALVTFGGIYMKAHEDKSSAQRMNHLEIIAPLVFFGVLLGGMLPFTFTAYIMKSIADIATYLVDLTKIGIGGYLASESNPMYSDFSSRCGNSTVKSAIPILIFAILLPFSFGLILGLSATSGLMVTCFIVSFILSTSYFTAGASWDSAKIYIKNGLLFVNGNRKDENSEDYKSAVVGDQVGDTFMQGAGGSLTSLMIFLSALFLAFFALFAKTSWLECAFTDVC